MITLDEFLAWLKEQDGRRHWNLRDPSHEPIADCCRETWGWVWPMALEDVVTYRPDKHSQDKLQARMDPDVIRLQAAVAHRAQMKWPLDHAWIYRGRIMRLIQEVRHEPRTIR